MCDTNRFIGKILTNKQKQEMADLFSTSFSPEAKTFHKDIAEASNHLCCEVELPVGLKEEIGKT
uniref:Uncharacterized protein n=1 Tax=Romanomermis culicivorax TaxID=13658 RepID=A0A915KPF3_ROMCU